MRAGVRAPSLEATGCGNNRAVALESDTAVSQDGKNIRRKRDHSSGALLVIDSLNMREAFGGIKAAAAAAAILLTVCI